MASTRSAFTCDGFLHTSSQSSIQSLWRDLKHAEYDKDQKVPRRTNLKVNLNISPYRCIQHPKCRKRQCQSQHADDARRGQQSHRSKRQKTQFSTASIDHNTATSTARPPSTAAAAARVAAAVAAAAATVLEPEVVLKDKPDTADRKRPQVSRA
eukprot:4693419-Pleurochrysis_carterae.AAC.2